MRTKESSTTVYFIRHGQTDFPNDRIYCDEREDPDLNRAGQADAKSAALYFRSRPIDAIYASPASRTLATATQVAQVTGKTVEQRPELRERRFGEWEGLYFREIEEQHPDSYRAWKGDPVNFTPVGGETVPGLQSRVVGAVQELVNKHRGQTLAVVTHVGPIRALVAHAFQIPLTQHRQIRIDYGSITRIDYGQTLNNLIFLNYAQNSLSI